MARIITIHGTNATGPVEGTNWWQTGSDFQQHIRALVGGKSGNLQFEPFIWDGRNSEASRFAAGRRLLTRLLSLENDAEDYCLIAHSHGGSVVNHCLAMANFNGHSLDHLRQWISVGTPFVETKSHLLLFSRLNYWGGAAYFILAYLFFCYLAFLISIFTAGPDNPILDYVIIFSGALFLLGLYFALRSFQPTKLKMFVPASFVGLRRRFEKKWLALWHKDDEAIQGLRLVGEIRLSPFDKNFATPFFSFMSLFILPFLMYLAYRGEFVDWSILASDIREWVPFNPTEDISPIEKFARDNLAIIAYPSHYLFQILKSFGVSRTSNDWVDYSSVGAVLLLGVFVGFVLLWIASLIFRLFVNIASSYLSSVLSRLLNQATRTQLRKLSLASDTIGEAGIVARHCPPWVTAPYKPLPQDLSDEIAKAADAAAALSIAKFRAALGTLVFTDQKTSVPDVIGEYLTWQELVHTSYFDVSRFRKLIACAISQVRGFEATSAFQADPDHLIVAGWYANLTTRQLADDT